MNVGSWLQGDQIIWPSSPAAKRALRKKIKKEAVAVLKTRIFANELN